MLEPKGRVHWTAFCAVCMAPGHALLVTQMLPACRIIQCSGHLFGSPCVCDAALLCARSSTTASACAASITAGRASTRGQRCGALLPHRVCARLHVCMCVDGRTGKGGGRDEGRGPATGTIISPFRHDAALHFRTSPRAQVSRDDHQMWARERHVVLPFAALEHHLAKILEASASRAARAPPFTLSCSRALALCMPSCVGE